MNVELDEEAAEPLAVEVVLAGVVRGATETMALMAEQRWERALRHRRSREQRIRRLARAVDAAGPRSLETSIEAAAKLLELGDRWAIWPVVFLLGRSNSPEASTRLDEALEKLDNDGAVEVAAEAAALWPKAIRAARDRIGAVAPRARAIGLETLAHGHALPDGALEKALNDSSPVVIAAALRALHAPSGHQTRPLFELLEHPSADVADLAGRALLRAGNKLPIDALRTRPATRTALGARAVEWLVLAGRAEDLDLLMSLPRSKPSPAFLSGLGRLGNPLVWSYLLHYVGDARVGDPAQAALATLFGDLVPVEERDEQNAWRTAIAARSWDAKVRYRRGEPWKPAGVVAECTSGELSAREVALRLDELAARTATPVRFDFAPFQGDVSTKLEGVLAPFERIAYRPGSWSL